MLRPAENLQWWGPNLNAIMVLTVSLFLRQSGPYYDGITVSRLVSLGFHRADDLWLPEVCLSKRKSSIWSDFILTRSNSSYCYGKVYMDGPERMDESNLPPQDKFFSRLSDSNISDEDYKHAQTVWTKFAMRTMRDYHDLYLKSDVILLADVFEEFRKMCLNYYKLDPVYYFSCPGLSFDAMLKMTKVKLSLITVPDHYLFVERGLRGGVSMISNRYAKANNKYLAQG